MYVEMPKYSYSATATAVMESDQINGSIILTN